jgi:M6 family metalloprotease-like protein
MQSALTEALTKLDGQIDFAQYADSSGFVPLVLFLHQAMGAECGPSSAPENHLWAHRFSLSPFTTQDPDPSQPGSNVKISDYVLQSAVGGASSCTPSQIIPIGTVAHETGHGFGLPDLYDTDYLTEGIGQWGLMSSGSFTSALSPSRMEAWSLNELGWVTIVPVTSTATYTINAAPLSDTAFYVRVQGANPRGEYYLLENRQRQQSDTALIRIHCRQAGFSPGSGCGGGLLIWHVDSAKLAQSFSNNVNSGPIHGLAVVQADAFGNLDAPTSGVNCPTNSISLGCSDRGDAGDLYPGTSGNPGLIFRTSPAALKDVDHLFAGFGIDSVKQLVTDNTLSFRIRFGSLTSVAASDTTAQIQFDGGTYNVYRDLLDPATNHTVNFPDNQVSSNGKSRFHFLSWSDGGAISHSIAGSLGGGAITANVSSDFKLIATAAAGGTVQADTSGVDLAAGVFIPDGRAVTLTATADAGITFSGWCGDSVSSNAVLTLPMHRPYTVTASFGSLSIASPASRPNGLMGALYADTLRAGGGTCAATWALTAGALPQGLVLNPTGLVSGYPKQVGDFTFTATVTAGTQSQGRGFTLTVTAPTLVAADVITQLLGPAAPLTSDQVRYLDFLGNNNSLFDIGDFLAWFKATGTPLTAEILQAMQKKGGPR